MGFLKRLFGREEEETSPTGYHDPDGIYLYVKCNHCGTCVKVRADKKYDLENTGNGYAWHKTIVDSKCFRPMQTIVQFDRKYEVVSEQLEGGEYISAEDYQSWLADREAAKAAAAEAAAAEEAAATEQTEVEAETAAGDETSAPESAISEETSAESK